MTVRLPHVVAGAAGLLLASSLGDVPVRADESALNAADREAVESVIRDYLKEHPEVVIQAIRTYQEQQAAREQAQTSVVLKSLSSELKDDPRTPFAGNPDGDVTVVEFFDYRCGYCKRVLPTIQALLEADSGVRYVFKEYPILGPDSVTAAKASLAVWEMAPEKYWDFHSDLLGMRGTLTEKKILALAEQHGLDRDNVKTTMEEDWVDQAIKDNYQLGQTLNIRGTPAFIVGDNLTPGAISLDALKEMVAEARSG